jgi:hypothetical protein
MSNLKYTYTTRHDKQPICYNLDQNTYFWKIMNFENIFDSMYDKDFDKFLENLNLCIRLYVSEYVEKKNIKFMKLKSESHSPEFNKYFEDIYQNYIRSYLRFGMMNLTAYMESNKKKMAGEIDKDIIKIYNKFILNLSKILMCILKWYGLHILDIKTGIYSSVGTLIREGIINHFTNIDGTRDILFDDILLEVDTKLKIKDVIIVDCKQGIGSYTCGRAVKYFIDKDGIGHILIYNTESKDSDFIDDAYEPIAEKKYNSQSGGYYQKYLKYKMKYLQLKKIF